MGNYCPFVNGICRNDCKLKAHNTSITDGINDCLIAISLDNVNEYMKEKLKSAKHQN